METSLIELLTYYVIVAVFFVGAPGVFFFIVFMPALQNTKGRMVGYKDHKTYGDSTIYEVNRTTWGIKMFNEKAEKLNGRAAMVGFIAAVGSYLATGQVIPGVW